MHLRALFPTLSATNAGFAQAIPIAPLDPTIVRWITQSSPSTLSKFATKTLSLLSTNHLGSINTRFVKKTAKKKVGNDFDAWNNTYLAAAIHGNELDKIDTPISDTAMQYALEQLGTNITNLYTKTNILGIQLQRLLTKIFSHQFAPKRTARHLEYLKLKSTKQNNESKAPLALLCFKRKRFAEFLVKLELRRDERVKVFHEVEAFISRVNMAMHLLNSHKLPKFSKLITRWPLQNRNLRYEFILLTKGNRKCHCFNASKRN